MVIGHEDQPWIEVKRRNRTSVFDRLGQRTVKSKQDQLESMSTTLYVANFPSHLSVRELWKICGCAGVVVDVFIGRNRNKLGQMFAFVRFIRVHDLETLVRELCNIRIGALWLHANVSKHPRKIAKKLNGGEKRTGDKNSKPTVGKASFASMVSGIKEDVKEKVDEKVESSYINIDCQVSPDNAYPFAVIGCYKDFRAIENTRYMCQGEGFLDIEPMYLGGLWVMLNFPNSHRRDAFLAHDAFKTWFSVLKPWRNDFVVKERIVWLEVEGIPVLAWGNETFKKIASKWGELLSVDNSDGTNRFSIRMGIKTLHAPLVFESTFVTVLGVEYCIRIRELSSWTPAFIIGHKDDEDGHCEEGSDSEKSDNSSIHSNDVFHYVAELPTEEVHGAIRENNVGGQFPTQEHLNNTKKDNSPGANNDPFNLVPLIEKVRGNAERETVEHFIPSVLKAEDKDENFSEGDILQQAGDAAQEEPEVEHSMESL